MKLHFKFLLGSVVFLSIAVLTASGHVGKVIPFAGTLNEMGFFVLNGMLGILYAIAGFSGESSDTKRSIR
jgi:hypothetical protein